MPKRLFVWASQAFVLAALSIAVAGCLSLRPPPPPEEPPPLAVETSGSDRVYGMLADRREDGADWAGALVVVEKALAKKPNSQAMLLRRAQLLLRVANDADEPASREEARAILARFADTNDAEARATIAWLAFDDGQRDEALAAAHAAADLDASSARVQVILSQLLRRNGDHQGALRAAERAVELDPRSGVALRQRARTRLALADVAGAGEDANSVLRSHRDDPEASAILAEAQWRQADFKGARRTLSSVPLSRRDARVLVPLARLEIAGDDAAAGRAHLEEAVAASPNDPQVHEALLELDIREKRVGDSIARLDAAVAARPDDAALHRLRGVALGADRRDDEASASFARSLAIDPNDVATYTAVVEFLRARTKSDAIERRAAELGIGAGPSLVTVGLLREASGDRSGARSHFQKALEADPNLSVARGALAASLAASGENLDQALELARAARAARPTDPVAADILGRVHMRRGQTEAASEVMGEAAGGFPAWSPAFAEELFQLARTAEASGEREGAHRTVEVALALIAKHEPEPSWAANARSLLARAKPTPKPEPKREDSAESQTAANPEAAAEPAPVVAASPADESAAAEAAAPESPEATTPPPAPEPEAEAPAEAATETPPATATPAP